MTQNEQALLYCVGISLCVAIAAGVLSASHGNPAAIAIGVFFLTLAILIGIWRFVRWVEM